MKWFKHIATARMGNSLNAVMEQIGVHYSYSCYFLLLECCVEKYDGGEPLFVVREQVLRQTLATSAHKLHTFMTTCSHFELFTAEKQDGCWRIEFPMLVEIMGRDSKYARSIRAKNAVKPTLDKKRLEEIRLEEIRRDKKQKENYDRERSILSWWNGIKLIKHNETDANLIKLKKSLVKRKSFSDKEIFTAFTNYAEIVSNPIYIWTHKWTVFDFLQRKNADNFYPDLFNTDLFPKKQSNAQTKQDNMMDIMRRNHGEQESGTNEDA